MKDYRSLHRPFSFLAAFTKRSTEQAKTSPIKKVHMRQTETDADVRGNMVKQAYGVENL